MAIADNIIKVLGKPDVKNLNRGYDYYTWVLKDESYIKYRESETRIDYYGEDNDFLTAFTTVNQMKKYLDQSGLLLNDTESAVKAKIVDMKTDISDALEDLTPRIDSIGFDERNSGSFYPERFNLKKNILKISYYYETIPGNQLEKTLEDDIANKISEIVGIEPKENKNMFRMGRPDSNGKFQYVGITVNLTYDLTMVGRVKSKGFRAMLGLK